MECNKYNTFRRFFYLELTRTIKINSSYTLPTKDYVNKAKSVNMPQKSGTGTIK